MMFVFKGDYICIKRRIDGADLGLRKINGAAPFYENKRKNDCYL